MLAFGMLPAVGNIIDSLEFRSVYASLIWKR